VAEPTATSIRYALPVEAPVNLTVFNLQGQRVATLVQRVQGPGTYTVRFGPGVVGASGETVGTLHAGVYFYRLQAGGFTTTRKMLMLR
jgi:hypothetical protein